MTRSGVEADLKVTPYRETIKYPNNKMITYCFSSSLAQDRFLNEVLKNRDYIRKSLANRFKMKFAIADEFCDVVLYRRSERRGYLIIMNGDEIEWPAVLEYDGQSVLKMTSSEK